MRVLDTIFPEGIQIPDAFHDTNIVHLPTVKCVGGDTEVVLGDGTLTTIRELVESKLDGEVTVERDGAVHAPGDAVVYAMTSDGAVRPLRATRFARTRRGDRRLLRVTLKSGRELVATEEHPLFAASGWTHAGTLVVGDRVAIARRLSVRGAAQPLPQTHASPAPRAIVARAGRTYTAAFAQDLIDRYQQGETVTALAAGAEVRWQSVQSILKRHDIELRRNVVQISIPEHTSSDFWRWMGYVIAEGCAEDLEKGAGKLWFSNTDEALRDDFIALSRSLFGVDARERDAAKISIYSRDLVRFLGELGLANPLLSGNKTVPRLLYRCTDEEIAAFLSAYLDGDGTVSGKQAELSAVTKSKRLADDLVALFARLGVVAFVQPTLSTIPGVWEEPRTYYKVTVSGAPLSVLASKLRLQHPLKADRLAMHAARLAESKQPSNWDTVPGCADLVARIRKGLGLTQAATAMASSVNNIEHEYTTPTPRVVRALCDFFANADRDSKFTREIKQLRSLAHPDLAWDHVESIVEIVDDIPLYDITVPDAGSFIASGIVAHNCHIYTTTTGAMKNAFGGLLNTKRHYTHSWIHETLVDLLAIQKEIHS
ncbi:MAG: LAGLIDADG family homing endonuclease, partial [Kofleriaceae bacterium]